MVAASAAGTASERARGADAARIRALTRAVDESLADRVVPWAFGSALLSPGLPLVWDLNLLRVERPPRQLAAHRLAAAADDALGGVGLAHRTLELSSPSLTTRLARPLGRRGWKQEDLLAMALRRQPDRAPARFAIHDANFPELREAMVTYLMSESFGRDPETRRQLLAAAARAERFPGTRRLAVWRRGAPAAWCRLYLHEGIAQIEEVITHPAHRGRGCARALVLSAAELARDAGAELVFLLADAGDWPWRLYERLGFRTIDVHQRLRRP